MKKRAYFKYLSGAMAIGAAAITLAACGSTGGATQGTTASETTSEASSTEGTTTAASASTTASSSTGGTRTITDMLGRTVEIPATIEKADCQDSSTRMMVYAGAIDKVAGCAELEQTGSGSDAAYKIMPYAYLNKEHLSKCATTTSGWPKFESYMEETVKLDPDVILKFNANPTECDELAEKTGKPVVGLKATNFLSEDFQQTLTLLGDIMGTQEQAGKAVAAVKGYIEDLNKRTKDIPEADRPTVYTAALSFKGFNGFDGTSANFAPFMAVNAVNVVDETGEKGCMNIDLEKVAVWDPDYVFLNTEGLNLVNEDYAKNAAFYDSLSAVKNDNVYTICPFNAYATNMEIAIADAYFIGKTIYPDKFSDIEINDKADEIYEALVGDKYQSVLDSEGHSFRKFKIGE